MAYPTINGPYGLRPINLIGGQVYAGATRQMEIEPTYATNIFYGDFVKRVVGGFVELDDGTTANTPVGVFGLSSGVSSIALGRVRLLFDLRVVQTLCCHAVAGDDACCRSMVPMLMVECTSCS